MNRRQKVKAEAKSMSEAQAKALGPVDDGLGPLVLGSFTVPNFDGPSAVFGADLRDYPPMANIPEEFRSYSGKYQDIFSALFFRGGKLADHGIKLKNGISHPRAMRAIRAYMCSFAPQHEHKTATVAWALSDWTEPL